MNYLKLEFAAIIIISICISNTCITSAADLPIHILAYNNSPPYSYLDNHGLPEGYDIEIAYAIAEKLNRTAEIRMVSYPDAIQNLNKSIDLVAGVDYQWGLKNGMNRTTPTSSRKYSFYISRDNGDKSSNLITRTKYPAFKINNYQGEVAIGNDSAFATTLTSQYPNLDPVFYPSTKEALIAIKNGDQRVIFGELESVDFLISELNITGVIAIPPVWENNIGPVVVNTDTVSAQQISEIIHEMDKSGEIDSQKTRWIGKKVFPITAIQTFSVGFVPVIIILICLIIYAFIVKRYNIRLQKQVDDISGEIIEKNHHLEDLNHQLSELSEELRMKNSDLNKALVDVSSAHQALKQMNLKLTYLSSLTRHDLRNLIAALQMHLELLVMDLSDTPSESIRRMMAIIDTMIEHLEFARDCESAGSSEPIWQRLDILIKKAIKQINKEDINFFSDVGSYEICADPLLCRVFFNLIDNSLRHGERVKNISITVNSTTDLVIIYSDDGVGIPDSNKEKIFVKGYGSNTGLGLYLVREVLEMSGISITERGVYGQGVRFEIRVPEKKYR